MKLTGWLQAIGLTGFVVCVLTEIPLFVLSVFVHPCPHDTICPVYDPWIRGFHAGFLAFISLAILGASIGRSQDRKRFREEMRELDTANDAWRQCQSGAIPYAQAKQTADAAMARYKILRARP